MSYNDYEEAAYNAEVARAMADEDDGEVFTWLFAGVAVLLVSPVFCVLLALAMWPAVRVISWLYF